MLTLRLPPFVSLTFLSDLLESLVTYTTTRITRLLLSILSCGPIPRHIAIVMDGNRRYARERGLKVGRGHEAGFESLKGVSVLINEGCVHTSGDLTPMLIQILEQCLRLGIQCVSVYAFSIENFTRPREEIDDIMYLAKTNLRNLSEEGYVSDAQLDSSVVAVLAHATPSTL
jgi:ditrans,polycis-polyprenyl diphosphate synthase